MWIPQSLALITPVLAYRHYVVLSPSMSRSEADKACQSHGWKLADLDGFKHAEMILLESGAKGGWISTISGRNLVEGRALLMKRAAGRITVAMVPDCTTDNCKLFRAPAICEGNVQPTKASKTSRASSKPKVTIAARKHHRSKPEKSQSTKKKVEVKPSKNHRKSTRTGKKNNELMPRQVQSILATLGDFSNSENEKIIKGIKDDLLEGKRRGKYGGNGSEECTEKSGEECTEKSSEECTEKSSDEHCDGNCGGNCGENRGSYKTKKLRKRGYTVNEGKRHRKNGVNLAALQSIIGQPSSTSTLASSGSFSPVQSFQNPSPRSPQRRRVIATKQRNSKNSRKLKNPVKSTSTKRKSRRAIQTKQAKSPARRSRLPIGSTYSRSHSSSSLEDSISYHSFAEQIYASSSDGPAAIFRHRTLYRHIRHSSSSSSSSNQLPVSRLDAPILPRSMRGELQRTTRTLDIAGRQADLDAMRAKRREGMEMRRQEREARKKARGSKNKESGSRNNEGGLRNREGGLRNREEGPRNAQETLNTNTATNTSVQPVATIIP